MCKLLALKADDRDTDHETLVYEIYSAAESMADLINNDKKLLIEQWVNAYSKNPKLGWQRIGVPSAVYLYMAPKDILAKDEVQRRY